MNDKNECDYDLPYRRPDQNKHKGVQMKGMLPTEVIKPHAEAKIMRHVESFVPTETDQNKQQITDPLD